MEIERPQETNLFPAAEAKKAKRLLVCVVFFFLLINGAILYKVFQKPEPTYQGKTVTQWLTTMDDTEIDPQVVNAFGPDAWPGLLRALARKDTALKKAYFQLLDKLDSFGAQGTRKLQPIDEVMLRLRSRFWLMQLGPDAKSAVPELIKVAKQSEDLEIRAGAISVLGFVGLESPEALSALIELLREPGTFWIRDLILDDTVALAVGRFGNRATAAVPELVRWMRERKLQRPLDAIRAVGMIGGDAPEAVAALVALLSEPGLRNYAVGALADLGSDASGAVPALIQCLEDSEPRVWPLIVETLMKVGPQAKAAVPRLQQIELQQTNILRALAAMAIAKIEHRPEHAVPVFTEMLRQKNDSSEPRWVVRIQTWRAPRRNVVPLSSHETAAWLLAEVGPAAKEALPSLRRISLAADSRLRAIAARAIWKVSGEVAEAIPSLTHALSQKDEVMFQVALASLNEMGPKARASMPALTNFIAEKRNPWIERRQALEVLRMVDPDAAAKASLR